MKAIAINPGSPGVSLIEIKDPVISENDEVKVKVWYVGICGTDRELIEGEHRDPSSEQKPLVIGHEMLGQVVDAAEEVKTFEPGDFVVLTVRRGCNECLACMNNRSDLCYTGNYTERGIKGADGFQTEYVVEKEQYLIKIPEKLKDIGVLTEPMSVAAKAIDEAVQIQTARLKNINPAEKWMEGKRALIAGLGPIGLMAAFALRLNGAEVTGIDIVNEDSLRPQILKQAGGTYVDGRRVATSKVDEAFGEFDFVFEATGIARLQIELIDTLAPNGIYVATGIPAGQRPMTIDAGVLMQQLVLKNQVVVGSVNASTEHYKKAVEYLSLCMDRWPGVIEHIISEKIPYSHFMKAFSAHDSNEIKIVTDWTEELFIHP